jgi:hypothetical protein
MALLSTSRTGRSVSATCGEFALDEQQIFGDLEPVGCTLFHAELSVH